MIKSDELRINNLVLSKSGLHCKIVGLNRAWYQDEQSWHQDDNISEVIFLDLIRYLNCDGWFDISLFKGIPIDTEILRKFGFEYFDNIGAFCIKLLDLNDRSVARSKLYLGVDVQGKTISIARVSSSANVTSSEILFSIPCEFVHELQNKYRDFSGNDLEFFNDDNK